MQCDFYNISRYAVEMKLKIKEIWSRLVKIFKKQCDLFWIGRVAKEDEVIAWCSFDNLELEVFLQRWHLFFILFPNFVFSINFHSLINWIHKSVGGVPGIQTQGHRMEGTNKSNELGMAAYIGITYTKQSRPFG